MQKTYYTSSMLGNSEKAFVVSYEAYHHVKSGRATEMEIAAAYQIKQFPLLVKMLEHKVNKLTYEMFTAKISIEEFKAQMLKYKELEPEMLKQYVKDSERLTLESIRYGAQ